MEKNKTELTLKEQCEALAVEQYGDVEFKKMSNKHKGLFFIPITDNGKIVAYGIFRKITRFDIKTQIDSTTMSGSAFDGMETLVQDLHVGGTEDLLEDPFYFSAIMTSIQREINKYTGDIVKH